MGGTRPRGSQDWGAYSPVGRRMDRPTSSPYGRRLCGTETPWNGAVGRQVSRVQRGVMDTR